MANARLTSSTPGARFPEPGSVAGKRQATARAASLGLTLAIVAAGCEAPVERVESVAQPIIAGMPITSDPAIMAMLSFQGQQGARCTATLITPRLLIAAAHCITETPGFERHIFPGDNDRNGAAMGMLAIKAVITNPAYTAPRQGNDFCIIVLETPLPIRPMRLNRAALTGAQGKTIRYVGYGISVVGNLGSGGVKRQNTAPLAQVSNLLLTIGPNANQSCEGDSGGPMLLDMGDGEVIIGINSFVDAPACRRNSFFQRVDTQLGWIDEQIKKHDPDGLVPPTDAGPSDAQGPAIVDAGPDASSPMPPPPPPPPGPPDAQAPATDAAPVAPPTGSGGAPAPTPPVVAPSPAPPASSVDAAGGCRFSGNASVTGRDGAGASVVVAFTLAWVGRRRRRRSSSSRAIAAPRGASIDVLGAPTAALVDPRRPSAAASSAPRAVASRAVKPAGVRRAG